MIGDNISAQSAYKFPDVTVTLEHARLPSHKDFVESWHSTYRCWARSSSMSSRLTAYTAHSPLSKLWSNLPHSKIFRQRVPVSTHSQIDFIRNRNLTMPSQQLLSQTNLRTEYHKGDPLPTSIRRQSHTLKGKKGTKGQITPNSITAIIRIATTKIQTFQHPSTRIRPWKNKNITTLASQNLSTTKPLYHHQNPHYVHALIPPSLFKSTR